MQCLEIRLLNKTIKVIFFHNGFTFNSTIKSGGITFNYNFNQLLKKDHIIEPYIHLGIESIEYNSQIDTDPTDEI